MTVNLGILGFGGMGHWHYENASKIEGINVIAVCDIDEKQLKDAESKGLKAYKDRQAFLNDKNINTILVSAPNHLHKEMVIDAANAGKNIICEKPVALNVEELDVMIEAAEKNKVIFTVHQNRRWDRDFRIAKEAFDKNILGDIFSIESRLHGVNGLVHDWHVFKKYGGGMIYDWGVHLIDQMLYMVPGKVKTVFADIKNVINDEVDDYFKIILKFESGVTAHIELSTYVLKSLPRWSVYGDKGTLTVKSFACDGEITRTSKLMEKLPARIAQTVAGPTRAFAPPAEGALYTENLPEVHTQWTDFYKNFAKVVTGEEEQMIKIEEVKRVLALMIAAFKSAETGKTIDFE